MNEEQQLIRDVVLDKAFIIDCMWSYIEVVMVLIFRTLRTISDWGIMMAMVAIVFIIRPFSYWWFFFAWIAFGLLRILLAGGEKISKEICKKTSVDSKKMMLQLFLDQYDKNFHSIPADKKEIYLKVQGYYELVGLPTTEEPNENNQSDLEKK